MSGLVQRKYPTHRIRDLNNNKIGTVLDLLSVQFTAEFNGKVKFFFYQEQGLTWDYIKEEDDEAGNSRE